MSVDNVMESYLFSTIHTHTPVASPPYCEELATFIHTYLADAVKAILPEAVVQVYGVRPNVEGLPGVHPG